MVVVSMLPHAEIGGNDHREDAPQFMRARAVYRGVTPVPPFRNKKTTKVA